MQYNRKATPMPLENLPPPTAETVTGGLLAIVWALVGRLMYRARSAQLGRRPFLSPSLVYELPIAVGTGSIGQGVAEYLGLAGWAATACVVTAGYLGPGFAEAVVWRLLDRWAPPSRKGEADAS
jgi:hypothetical protein